jgi:hypothetical protein
LLNSLTRLQGAVLKNLLISNRDLATIKTIKKLIGDFIMQVLNVPTATVSDVKKSPGKVFEQAAKANNGVYVFNRGTVAGVMLTRQQYESLNSRFEEMSERLWDMETARRLHTSELQTYTDAQVRGDRAQLTPVIDPDDGWE